jgi:hypothetical protein
LWQWFLGSEYRLQHQQKKEQPIKNINAAFSYPFTAGKKSTALYRKALKIRRPGAPALNVEFVTGYYLSQ